MHDIIIIGAGAAGLAAGRALHDAGRAPLIVEARERIGGRVHTDRTHGPVELGAEFIHGDRAATWALVRAAGLRAELWDGPRLLGRAGRLLPEDDPIATRARELHDAVIAHDGPDESAASVLARLAAETGEALPTPRTLWKRLGERGFLHVQYEQGGTRYLVVRRVGGVNRRVLHLRAEHLAPYISQKPVAPVAGEENPVQNGANPATGSLAATDFPVAGESPVGAQKGATEKPVAGEKPVAAETPSRTAQNGGATGATGFAEIYPPMGRVEEEEGEWL